MGEAATDAAADVREVTTGSATNLVTDPDDGFCTAGSPDEIAEAGHIEGAGEISEFALVAGVVFAIDPMAPEAAEEYDGVTGALGATGAEGATGARASFTSPIFHPALMSSLLIVSVVSPRSRMDFI